MRFTWLLAGMAAVSSVAGCGNSPSTEVSQSETLTPARLAIQPDGPEAAVVKFLEAIRTGSDDAAAQMLTPLAREKTAEYQLAVAPPGSDTATFKVGEVEMIGDEGAHVASFWTDIDVNGEKHTDTIVWMVRKEAQGWRIAGMATRVIEDQPPVILNFEDPEDMLAKQQQIEEEMAKQSGAAVVEEAVPAATANRLRGENLPTTPPKVECRKFYTDNDLRTHVTKESRQGAIPFFVIVAEALDSCYSCIRLAYLPLK